MSLSSKQWLSFYLHQGADHKERSLVDIWTMTFDELESKNDFIQWLFPLPTGSNYLKEAPKLTPELIFQVYQTPEIQRNLLRSFDTLAAFWGFMRTNEETIERTAHFETQSKSWCCEENHNHKRITRMLKNLTLTGHTELAAQTCEFLLSEIDHAGLSFSQIKAIPYWMGAVEIDEELELTLEDFEESA